MYKKEDLQELVNTLADKYQLTQRERRLMLAAYQDFFDKGVDYYLEVREFIKKTELIVKAYEDELFVVSKPRPIAPEYRHPRDFLLKYNFIKGVGSSSISQLEIKHAVARRKAGEQLAPCLFRYVEEVLKLDDQDKRQLFRTMPANTRLGRARHILLGCGLTMEQAFDVVNTNCNGIGERAKKNPLVVAKIVRMVKLGKIASPFEAGEHELIGNGALKARVATFGCGTVNRVRLLTMTGVTPERAGRAGRYSINSLMSNSAAKARARSELDKMIERAKPTSAGRLLRIVNADGRRG